MKKNIYVVFSVFLFYSCIGDGMTDEQREFYAQAKQGPTEKEINLIYELEKLGYSDINIISPDYSIDGESSKIYSLNMASPFNLTKNNSDSIISISDSLADVLYSKVLSDSVIFASYGIRIHFRVKKIETTDLSRLLWQSYSKKSLEKWNDFKVVEVSEGQFKRVKV